MFAFYLACFRQKCTDFDSCVVDPCSGRTEVMKDWISVQLLRPSNAYDSHTRYPFEYSTWVQPLVCSSTVPTPNAGARGELIKTPLPMCGTADDCDVEFNSQLGH